MSQIQTIRADQIDFTNGASVMSAAQKFVFPVPTDGAQPLVYPEGHEKAGQPITDWQGNPVGDVGIVFWNAKDSSWQAAVGGTGIVIINQVTAEQAERLHSFVLHTVRLIETNTRNQAEHASNQGIRQAEDYLSALDRKDGRDLTVPQLVKVLQYAEDTLGLGDQYNSDKGFADSKLTPVGELLALHYGLHKRDDRDICLAVRLEGNGSFEGPAATPQQFTNGAVLVKQGDDVRLIQSDIFVETYTGLGGETLDLDDIPQA